MYLQWRDKFAFFNSVFELRMMGLTTCKVLFCECHIFSNVLLCFTDQYVLVFCTSY